MKARLINLWEQLRASFWFVPALMTVSAIVLCYGLIALDSALSESTTQKLGWLYGGGAEGARVLMSTIAGSVITVAGVTFSITIVALTLASSQFGPRLLRNFMREPANHLVLGAFIATFIYCLLVLPSVKGPGGNVFVPHIAISFGIVLTLMSMAFLIYFIHHVAASMQADNVIATVFGELEESIDDMFPERREGVEENEIQDLREKFRDAARKMRYQVPANRNGYLQAIDVGGLVDFAADNDLLLESHYRPGQFVFKNSIIVSVWGQGEVAQRDLDRLNQAFILGRQRTPEQDIEFSIKQLVEIAVRALSPGINDPFTAMVCVDRLGAAICLLGERQFPPPVFFDGHDKPRVLCERSTYTGVLDAAFTQIRRYARDHAAVLMRLLAVLEVIADTSARPSGHRKALHDQAVVLVDDIRERFQSEADYDGVCTRCDALMDQLRRMR